MSYTVNATFLTERIRPEGSSPIMMYVINASLTGTDYLYYANYNQDVYGYQLDTDGNMTANSQIYTGGNIKAGDVKSNTQGEIPRLDISVPNVDRVMESYIQTADYLRGREVYVITTFARTLPAGSTATYLGDVAYEDYNAVLKEKLVIDSCSSNENVVTFSCTPKFNVKKVGLPNRRYSRECAWEYNGVECDGAGVISASPLLVASPCNGTLTACISRENSSQFGGFPSIPRRAIYV